MTLTKVKELLGHRDIQAVLRYAHWARDHKWKAIAKMGKPATMDTYVDTKPRKKERGYDLCP